MARFRSRSHAKRRHVPRLEMLEDRTQPSAFNPLVDVGDTLNLAWDLGNLSVAGAVQLQENIGNSFAAADVDWYAFQLDQPATVTLRAGAEAGGNFSGLISLWNNDPSSPDPAVALLKHRLLGNGDGTLTVALAAGSYFVGVSGPGNAVYHPFLADSGSIGATGSYRLDAEAVPLDLPGLAILGSDIPAGNVFTESPLGLHLRLNQDIDISSCDVQIFQLADGVPIDFVMLQLATFSPDSHELQMVFNKGLNAGSYMLIVFDMNTFEPLFEPLTFDVAGIEGGAQANDTADTATDLGTLSAGAVLHQGGWIGNNPAYDNTGDPTLPSPGADLDVYHFVIAGAGQYGLVADLFANRIGSPLDAGLTLFRVVDGQAVLLAGNNNTLNPVVGSDGSVPLFIDSALYAALTAGEYYLVVSGAENALDPNLDQHFGPATYDPVVGPTPLQGTTTGAYLLNLFLTPNDQQPPEVIQTNVAAGAVLVGSPTEFQVRFSETVNIQQLAYFAFQQQQDQLTPAVFVTGPAGQVYYPRFVGYDDSTFTARFVMLDAMTNGGWELHVAGAAGLHDLSGNAVAGNNGQGDFVVPFTVTAAPPVPLHRDVSNPVDSFGQPQQLGVLFAHDLEQGLLIARHSAAGDDADYFRFTVLQTAEYAFILGGAGRNVPGRPVLLDGLGNEVTLNPHPTEPTNPVLRVVLPPGSYVIKVEWDGSAVATPVYELTIVAPADQENPTPLTQGPAPAFRLRLVTNVPGTPPPTPQLSLPPPTPIVSVNLTRTPPLTLPAPTGPANSLLALASAPIGVSGPTGAASSTVVRLLLPSTDTVAGKQGLLLTGEDPTGSKGGENQGFPEEEDAGLSLFWRGLVERLFAGLQELVTPLPKPTPPPADEMPEDPEAEIPDPVSADEPEAATFQPDAGTMDPAQTGGSYQAWAGVLLTLGGMALHKDEGKKHKPVPTRRPPSIPQDA